MNNYMDPNGYAQIQKLLDKANETYAKVYHAMNKAHIRNLESIIDTNGLIEEYRQKVIKNKKRLMNLQAEMKAYLKEYEAAQSKVNFSDSYLDDHVYGTFGTLATTAAIDYTAYKTYQFAQSGKSFATDYNDAYSFMYSDIYQDMYNQISISEWSNYELYLDAILPINTGAIDNYTNTMLETALASLLESIPGTEPDLTADGLWDQFSDLTGIEAVDKWLSLLKSVLSECAANQVPFDVAKNMDTVKAVLDMFAPEERGLFLEQLANVYNTTLITEGISTVSDAFEILDVCVDSLVHCYNSYAAQVSYLDSMQTALLNAGFAHGPVHDKIDELRKHYEDEFSYALDKATDYVVKQGKGAVKKAVIKKATEYIPIVKDVDFGLKVVDTAGDIIYADEISAFKTLGGLTQYDSALTTAYEQYIDMMEAGVATAADMREADRIYTILRSTKVKEYESILSLCEGRDQNLFNNYNQKYYELTGKYYNNIPVPGSSGNIHSGGGRRI